MGAQPDAERAPRQRTSSRVTLNIHAQGTNEPGHSGLRNIRIPGHAWMLFMLGLSNIAGPKDQATDKHAR